MAKILVSVDDRLLARIDKEAHTRGLSRSGYLSQLAVRHLDARPGPGRQVSVRRALARLDGLIGTRPGDEDSTIAVRQERDAH